MNNYEYIPSERRWGIKTVATAIGLAVLAYFAIVPQTPVPPIAAKAPPSSEAYYMSKAYLDSCVRDTMWEHRTSRYTTPDQDMASSVQFCLTHAQVMILRDQMGQQHPDWTLKQIDEELSK
jgi:hypothetical protein